MTDPLSIGADNNRVIRNERIAMKAGLIAILVNVVTPQLLPGLLIERVESACAGTDKYNIASDRWGGPDSTAGFKLPPNLRVRSLSKACRRHS